jgi:hypothetical protein
MTSQEMLLQPFASIRFFFRIMYPMIMKRNSMVIWLSRIIECLRFRAAEAAACTLSGGCDSRQDSCYNSRPYLKPEPDFRQAVNRNGQLIIIQKMEGFAKGRRAGSIREDAA